MNKISLNAKIRKEIGRKTQAMIQAGRVPAVVYGHGVQNAVIDVDALELKRVFKEAGESSLIELSVEGEKEPRLVLVHELKRDPVTDKFVHLDLLQPSLKEKVEVAVPLVFEGEAPAVKDLGGTLVRNISELQIKALPQNLPHEIKVSIESLKNFEDRILVKDIALPKDVETTLDAEEIVALVAQAEDIESQLETPIEENVDEVEKVEKEKKEEEVVEEAK